jgi:hypothetical protein
MESRNTSFIFKKFGKTTGAVGGTILSEGLVLAGQAMGAAATDTSFEHAVKKTWYLLLIFGLVGAAAGYKWAKNKARQLPILEDYYYCSSAPIEETQHTITIDSPNQTYDGVSMEEYPNTRRLRQ